jgi:hypothetical protein
MSPRSEKDTIYELCNPARLVPVRATGCTKLACFAVLASLSLTYLPKEKLRKSQLSKGSQSKAATAERLSQGDLQDSAGTLLIRKYLTKPHMQFSLYSEAFRLDLICELLKFLSLLQAQTPITPNLTSSPLQDPQTR